MTKKELIYVTSLVIMVKPIPSWAEINLPHLFRDFLCSLGYAKSVDDFSKYSLLLLFMLDLEILNCLLWRKPWVCVCCVWAGPSQGGVTEYGYSNIFSLTHFWTNEFHSLRCVAALIGWSWNQNREILMIAENSWLCVRFKKQLTKFCFWRVWKFWTFEQGISEQPPR